MLAISRFRVANGLAEAVKQAFENRPRLVEQATGFQGITVFTELEDPSTFLLITQWSDLDSYRAWHSSEAHNLSHAGIPAGLKLDAAQTQLTFWDEIPERREDPAAKVATPDWTEFLADFASSSGAIYLLAFDGDGTISGCNAPMAELLGVPLEKLRGQTLWPYLTEPDATRLKKSVRGGETAGGAADGASAETVLLNFVPADQAVHTLECKVYVRDGLAVVIGSLPYQPHPTLQEGLRDVNYELMVLTRENARQNKELKAAKLALEKTLLELNTVYWHLRKVGEVLPICMKCGKVESGESRWETLVAFMQERFPFLSHGYCPECASELLADLGKGPRA